MSRRRVPIGPPRMCSRNSRWCARRRGMSTPAKSGDELGIGEHALVEQLDRVADRVGVDALIGHVPDSSASRPDSCRRAQPTTERPVPQEEDRASRDDSGRVTVSGSDARMPGAGRAHGPPARAAGPATAHTPSTSHGNVASAPGKYDRSRSSVAPAPGGNHWPTAPHGSGRNSTGVAADASGTANRMKVTAPSAEPGPADDRRESEHGGPDGEQREPDGGRVDEVRALQDAEPALQDAGDRRAGDRRVERSARRCDEHAPGARASPGCRRAVRR